MNKRQLLLLLLGVALSTALSAQSWRSLQKTADGLLSQGKYAEAGAAYEAAWQKRQKNKELIFKAGEAYYTVRDYRKAAEAYQHVKNDNDAYPLVGLKYARSLKQDGQYDKAITAFRDFDDKYTGDAKSILQDVIAVEILGANLGISLPSQSERSVELVHGSSRINTAAEEFAPFPANDDEVWFSSAMGGQARIYASKREGKTWSKAANPPNFPVVQGGQYGNGSFSPDGSRYYFTICSSDKEWQNLNTRCEIFVTKNNNGNWSQPERLPDYINTAKVTATNPFVTHSAGQEIMYFASNREGGRGGMDIWYATRDLGMDNNDFTFPVNAGPIVNTLGDEITPFYEADENTLWFASNGQVSIGGFDVFKSKGEEASWSAVENAGLPINSSADDFGYVKNSSGAFGFLVSNRAFGNEKPSTQHGDIFEFTTSSRRLSLKGNVYDKVSGSLISQDITVSLFQLYDDGTENLLTTKAFSGGNYLFELLPNRSFRVEVKRDGYAPATYAFSTDAKGTYTYGQPTYLEAVAAPDEVITMVPTQPAKDNKTPAKPKTESPPPAIKTPPSTDVGDGATYTAKGTAEKDKLAYTSSAPKHAGVYYKIQLAAVKRYDANHKGFQAVSPIGRLDTETLVDKSMTRVLVGDYFSESEATSALYQVRYTFKNAYIVKYEDGVRYGKVNVN